MTLAKFIGDASFVLLASHAVEKCMLLTKAYPKKK